MNNKGDVHQTAPSMPHNLILESRRSLTVSGVFEIDNFDENVVVAHTEMGELTISGSSLQINRFNVETGELGMEGEIQSLSYSESRRVGGGFFSRLFK